MRHPAADPEDVRRIIRLIDSDPEIRDEIRRVILTRELLELPQSFAAFAEATERRFEAIDLQFQAIDQRFEAIDLQFQAIDQRFEAIDLQFQAIDRRFQTIEDDLGALKGDSYERRVRERAPAILSRVTGGVRRLKVIPTTDLADQLDEAVDAGRINDAERDEALSADLVARGALRTSGQPVHLTVEASVTIGSSDVRRAILRSRLISQALSVEGIAVVVTSRAPGRLSTEGVEVVLFASSQEREAA